MEDRFNTADQMRESVFVDGPQSGSRYSRFWLLLVVADSTATVIGAMIVAPLMTPILGTMLATVLGDRANLIRSLLLAIAISLVPPLTVAGLALESGSLVQFLGALLLFLTNVVAIIGTGIVVMSLYGVSRLTREIEPGVSRWARLRRPTALLAVMFARSSSSRCIRSPRSGPAESAGGWTV
ncbi:DUF389 domain-containing protein [Lacisediminihabitans sp.]|uniref:DUF389 domain-containing protein n=1 Tax=Lacisediminihabitans sp. TaxID=2787631 RepID=UPI00374DB93D